MNEWHITETNTINNYEHRKAQEVVMVDEVFLLEIFRWLKSCWLIDVIFVISNNLNGLVNATRHTFPRCDPAMVPGAFHTQHAI